MQNTEFKVGDIVNCFWANQWREWRLKIVKVTNTGRYTVINEVDTGNGFKKTFGTKHLRIAV